MAFRVRNVDSEVRNMTQDQMEIVAIREAGFSRYDKALHSKCKKPELYGIRRVAAAEKAIESSAVRSPKQDKRKFKCRVSCRLPQSEYALLQRAFAQSNEKTMQDYARRVLIDHAKAQIPEKQTKEKAPDKPRHTKN